MKNADRFREKMVRGLDRALADEAAHVRKYSLVGRACGVAGGLVLAIAFLATDASADLWLLVAGMVAGILIGLAVYFLSSVEQWPVTREFLKVDEVREAARRYEP
jgi:hypothetical protein